MVHDRSIFAPSFCFFLFHIHRPNALLRFIDDATETECGKDEDGGEGESDVCLTEEDEEGVDEDEDETNFRGADAEVRDAEFVGGGEVEIGVDHVSCEDRENEELEVFQMIGKDETIADLNGAEKNVIEKVIHVIAPLDETGVAISTYGAVEEIGEILRSDHGRNAPHPSYVRNREIAEKHDEETDRNRCEREVIRLNVVWNFRYDKIYQPSLECVKDGAADFFVAGKGLRGGHIWKKDSTNQKASNLNRQISHVGMARV